MNQVVNTYEPEEIIEEINTTNDLINVEEIEKKSGKKPTNIRSKNRSKTHGYMKSGGKSKSKKRRKS